jgi:hypothetical protein
MAARTPVLDHLVALTDNVGVFQHARFDVPRRAHGYCTDDVARALIVAVEAARRRGSEAIGATLTSTYLAYLVDAQLPDGWFHNFMGYDRRWQDARGTEDAFGRAVWGLGHAAVHAPRESWRRVARALVDAAQPHIADLPHVRSRAYAALGLAQLALAEPGNVAIQTTLRAALTPIVAAYHAHATPDWQWCEPVMTYDNARLCDALIRGGSALRDAGLVRVGLDMLRFLAAAVVEDGVFVPVGNDGWFPQGGIKARFGQQPLEAASFVDAALAALAVTGDEHFSKLARAGGDWFFGRNTAGALLVANGGCSDGIDAHGVNANMGAESTLSYLMSAIALAPAAASDIRLAR